MLTLITVGLFFIIGLTVVETIQKLHPANPIVNPLWESLCLGITNIVWILLQYQFFNQAPIQSTWLILGAIFGSVLAMILSLIFWYFHDSTGKSRYTLRNAYLLIGLYRFVLYSISICVGALLSRFLHLK